MSFLPKAAGALAGGVVGSQLFGGGGVKGALGAATGGIAGAALSGAFGGKSKTPGPQDSPYYRPQMDAQGNPISMRAGRGAKALSV